MTRHLPVLALLAGCRLGVPDSHWTDQLSPEGVCWEVNLSDGLDDTSTDELHALFACLNRTGNLEPLAELDEVMDERSRTDDPIGITVVKLMNRLPASGFDIFGLAGKALQALQDDDLETELVLHIAVELIYGRPYREVASQVDLRSITELDQGLIRPVLPLISELAEVLLDDGDDVPDLAVDILNSDRLDDAACTVAALFDADDPELVAISETLLPTLGAAYDAVTEPSNDLWSEASGNSAKDLADALLLQTGSDGKTAVEAITPAVLSLLADDELRDRIAIGLALAEARGQLDELPSQFSHLIHVDVDGYPIVGGRDSALHAGIRMLHRGDTDLVCSAGIFSINLGNLSETIIEILADEGIDDITDLVDFLGIVLDIPLTDFILEEVAEEGYCPPIDAQFLEDIRIIERFHDDEVQALLPMTMEFLDAIHPERGTSRVRELLDVLSILYEREAIPPVEEAIRDLAPTQLAQDAMTLLPYILDPEDLKVEACPPGSSPLDFNTIWAIGQDAVSTRAGGDTPLQNLEPVLRVLVEHEATWTTGAHAARLAQEPSAEIQELPRLAVQGLDAIEDGSQARSGLADLLADDELREPLLALLENRALMDAAGRSEPDVEGPLPFVARLITSEAVTSMLQTIDLVLDSLGGSDDSPSD